MSGGKRLAQEAPKKKKLEWHKIIALLTILAGLLITQECMYLMYQSTIHGITATAAYLTAGVGLGEAVIIAGCKYYFGLAKSDHSEGGITFESAKARGFVEPYSYETAQKSDDTPTI